MADQAELSSALQGTTPREDCDYLQFKLPGWLRHPCFPEDVSNGLALIADPLQN